MSFLDEAKAIEQNLVTWRRHLHQIPELGIKLPQTVAYISEQLSEMGIEHEIMEDCSCIVATIGKGDKCILLRGDMDALPVMEDSGEEFACTTGVSHTCGHDLHATNILGTAKILKEHEAELNGTVKLFFQSGEEVFKGAKAAVANGLLENPKVDAAFAMHVFDMYPMNQICWGKMGFGAVYGFQITIKGKGGHGSQPDKCIDPINAAVQVYLALQAIIARECSPVEEAALTIGQFNAGNAANVIPDTAVLSGTLRTFKPAVRSVLIQRINEISVDVAKAYRCEAAVEVQSDVPSVICDDAFSEECIKSVEKLGYATEIRKDLHLIGSEDFAVISDLVPSCYFIIGTGNDDPAKRYGQHNPKIRFNEKSMVSAVATYCQVAMDYLNK